MSTNVSDIALDQDASAKTTFGFWVYLMTDCVLFASLFATYAVLHNNVASGPAGSQLFSLPYVLAETFILLTSSFTCGLGTLAAQRKDKRQVLIWFGLTFALGITFLAMEIHEFAHLAHLGDSWRRSGFLSSYFTLVGTHGLHITVGLLWMAVLVAQAVRRGFTDAAMRRLSLLGMFWHFLDIIWIFIFTIVYLMGFVS